MKKNIPPLREAFILHLLADPEMCATRAYKAAGYKCKNDAVAANGASKLLRIAYIAEAVEQEKAKRSKRLKASIDKTLLKLMRGQEFDIRRLYKEDPFEPGRMIMKHPIELDDDTAAAVIGVKYNKNGTIEEYKIIDVRLCTQLVGDHLGMFRQKVELTGKDGEPLNMHPIDLSNRILSLIVAAKKRKTTQQKDEDK